MNQLYKKGISLIALVITIVVLVILTGAVVITTMNNNMFDNTNSAVNEYNKKVIIQDIQTKIQVEKLMKANQGIYTLTMEEIIPIIQEHGTFDNNILKLTTVQGIQIWLYEIMPIPLEEYATITYENNILTVQTQLTSNGYILKYTIDAGTNWNTYNQAVTVTDESGIMVRLTNEQGQVVSNTIKVTQDGNEVIDNTRPTVRITADTTDITNVDSIKYTIEFSEAVIGFTIEDITVNNGTKGEFTKINETTYTIVVTNDTDCIQTITVAEGVCTDIANNENIQGSKEININRTVPTVVISPNGSSATKEINVTITASGVNELRADNEYKYCLTQNQTLQGNETWQDYINEEPITIGTGLNGTYYIHTKQICDIAGNYSEAVTSNQFIFDNTQPTCSITAYVSGSNVINTITFSEPVTDFTASDITVSNGTKGSFSGSGTTYSLTVTGGSAGIQTVSVPANAVTDSAGNGNTVSNTRNVTISNKTHTYKICQHIGTCTSSTKYTCPYCKVVVSSSYYYDYYSCPVCGKGNTSTYLYYLSHSCTYTSKTVN